MWVDWTVNCYIQSAQKFFRSTSNIYMFEIWIGISCSWLISFCNMQVWCNFSNTSTFSKKENFATSQNCISLRDRKKTHISNNNFEFYRHFITKLVVKLLAFYVIVPIYFYRNDKFITPLKPKVISKIFLDDAFETKTS